MLNDLEVGRRYLTRNGKEVMVSSTCDWGLDSKGSGRLSVAYYRIDGYDRCVFANGRNRGTPTFDDFKDPRDIVSELYVYEQEQLDLFGD
jgi:hypothetical protein